MMADSDGIVPSQVYVAGRTCHVIEGHVMTVYKSWPVVKSSYLDSQFTADPLAVSSSLSGSLHFIDLIKGLCLQKE